MSAPVRSVLAKDIQGDGACGPGASLGLTAFAKSGPMIGGDAGMGLLCRTNELRRDAHAGRLLRADPGQGAVFGHWRLDAESGADVQSPPAPVYGRVMRAEDRSHGASGSGQPSSRVAVSGRGWRAQNRSVPAMHAAFRAPQGAPGVGTVVCQQF
ncbi:hypothetical protein XAC3810_530060 [Xanthomonas citri pv. citri]|uniref:Uncharacterized protein n=1 Tax=Xanthomonas citri pv. citri TaxID=611301 RepID=A0A0U5FMA9_XANCI|nr:hypothetical protein XAC9322_530060 [Xanthomonas citri pv. citri]CEE31842.1 hypothetical protein XAC3824_670060 [Xanthomonas citri pv. citri]CEE33291.1 hypothetical protein XAC1083_530034 [Xanthomonas citri pv. citri]CEE42631.1 hypothetical protein XAC3810_530060 [Xanthomonas citri pv. citri]CEE44425.1 hypothetical protein XAC902_690061 [Xanthomonas citri pv. citri]